MNAGPAVGHGARLIVGVTAHRDLAPGDAARVEAEVRAVLERLRASWPALPVAVMSALAEGGDRLVARVALELGLNLVAPLPLPRELYLEDFADTASRAEFEALLARAEVVELPPVDGAWPEPGGSSAGWRSRQYAQLGVYISSHCQVLLALWDGRPVDATGGTSAVVNYHLHGEMPGLSAEDEPPNLLADDDSDLVYHIDCRRERDARDAPPAPPRWLQRNGSTPGSAPMPEVYRRMFTQLAGYNADAARHVAAIEGAGRGLLPTPGPLPWPPEALAIERQFLRADWLAVHYRKRVRASLALLHGLALATGLVFLLYSEFERTPAYIALLLGFFALGYGVARLGERREWHRRYLDYRVLAEGLRVQCYWVIAGVPAVHRVRFAYDSFLQKQDVELGWIRHAMRGANLAARAASDDVGLEWVVREWVGDGGDGGQLGYYRRRAAERERQFHRTERLGRASLMLSLGSATTLLFAGTLLPATVATTLLVTMGIAALFAGVREAWSHKLADKELIKQYRFMARIFAGAAQRLADARGPVQRRNVLEALGVAALEEHAEWILVHRERPLEHNRLG